MKTNLLAQKRFDLIFKKATILLEMNESKKPSKKQFSELGKIEYQISYIDKEINRLVQNIIES